MNRIEVINSYISNSDKVVDVGCDQAKLGIMLSKRNQSLFPTRISLQKNMPKSKLSRSITNSKNNSRNYSTLQFNQAFLQKKNTEINDNDRRQIKLKTNINKKSLILLLLK